jgi:uncharacterized protein YbcI
VGLETHVHEEDQVVQKITVLLGRTEKTFLQLQLQDFLENLELAEDERIRVVLLERDVEEYKLVP